MEGEEAKKVEDIAKLFGLGVVGVVGSIILNNAGKKDIAFYFDLTVLILGGMIVIPKMYSFFNNVITTFGVGM